LLEVKTSTPHPHLSKQVLQRESIEEKKLQVCYKIFNIQTEAVVGISSVIEQEMKFNLSLL